MTDGFKALKDANSAFQSISLYPRRPEDHRLGIRVAATLLLPPIEIKYTDG